MSRCPQSRPEKSVNNDTQKRRSKALDGAFCAAFILTGCTQAAEHAVLDGIAATEFDNAVGDVFLLETVKAAIQRRRDSAHQSQQSPSSLPLELRRLFLLAPISRACPAAFFVYYQDSTPTPTTAPASVSVVPLAVAVTGV
jgi:hypothetical protein